MKLFYLFMVTFITASFSIFGQSIKDFYIPSEKNYDIASYYRMGESGIQRDFEVTIFYKKIDNLNYEIEERNTWRGDLISNQLKNIIIFPTEIKMTRIYSTSIVKGGNRDFNYEPPITLLKMPISGEITSWTIMDERDESIQKCSSSMTTVTLNGIRRRAIKVVTQTYLKGIEEPSFNNSKLVAYYVQGFGLLNTDFISAKGDTKPFLKFNNLSTKPNSVIQH